MSSETKGRTASPASEPNKSAAAASLRESPRWKRIALAAGFGAATLLTIAAAIVMYIPTSQGTLRVEINDPSIEVAVKGSDVSFKNGKAEEFKLAPGEMTLLVTRGDLTFETNKFELKKDGVVAVRVELLPGEVRVATRDGRPLGGSKLRDADGKAKATSEPRLANDQSWQATPEQQQWLDMTAKLGPEELAKAIGEKLKAENPGFDGVLQRGEFGTAPVKSLSIDVKDVERIWPLRAARDLDSLALSGPHGGGGKLADLSPLQGMKLAKLTCIWTAAADLSALRGMRLTYLDLLGSPIADLTPLEGMPLEHLNLSYAPVSDLSPLKGMPLVRLFLSKTSVSDLSELHGMQLQEIQFSGTGVTDLTPLAGMPLKSIDMGSIAVADLSPLRGMKLVNLYASYNARLHDISVLRGMPLTRLDIGMTSVADLAPLQGMLLESLDLRETPVSDLRALKDLPLRSLQFDVRLYDPHEALLRSLPCAEINHMPADEFWKGRDVVRRAAEEFAARVATLPPEDRERAIKKRLEELNPDKPIELFRLTATDRTEAQLLQRAPNPVAPFEDVSPLMAAPNLKKATIVGGAVQLDLSPLLRTELEELTCSEDQARNNRRILSASKTLKWVNGEPAADYLAKLGRAP